MKTTVYLCLGISRYEHDKIGPILSDEDNAKKWVEKCKKLAAKKEEEHENDENSEQISEIVEKYKKLFEKIDGDMYADDYSYIKKILDSIQI